MTGNWMALFLDGNGRLARFLFMAKDKYLKYKDNRKKTHGLRKQNQKMYPAEKIVRGVESLALTMIETEGLELVHVEYIRESVGWILRCYIDRPGGVTIDDCADVSRMLSDLLDVALESWLERNIEKKAEQAENTKKIIPVMYLPPYMLEVSSPGEKRPLKKKKDFIRFQGKKIIIKVHTPINGQKRFKGVLSEANDSQVTIETATLTQAIDYENIRMARLDV
ncbi:Ribosome maturation factor rimP [Candidatus Magnetomorum sp. HK-1]|nr:Ribosome maturation factor rimP [Candidatus Magnetomorum sp. HK-1]